MSKKEKEKKKLPLIILDNSSHLILSNSLPKVNKYSLDIICKNFLHLNSEKKATNNYIKYLNLALQIHHHVKHLRLSHNKISVENFSGLALTLTKNMSLLELSLADTNMNDKGLKMLAAGLKENNTLTKLDLSHNNVSSENIPDFIKALENNNSLLKLSLAYNKLGNEGLEIFTRFLNENDNNLISVNLSKNGITAKGIIYFLKSLSDNCSLIHLNLLENEIMKTDFKSVVKEILNNRTFLRFDIDQTDQNENILLIHLYDNQNLFLLTQVIKNHFTPSPKISILPSQKYYHLFAFYKKDYKEIYKILLRKLNSNTEDSREKSENNEGENSLKVETKQILKNVDDFMERNKGEIDKAGKLKGVTCWQILKEYFMENINPNGLNLNINEDGMLEIDNINELFKTKLQGECVLFKKGE